VGPALAGPDLEATRHPGWSAWRSFPEPAVQPARRWHPRSRSPTRTGPVSGTKRPESPDGLCWCLCGCEEEVNDPEFCVMCGALCGYDCCIEVILTGIPLPDGKLPDERNYCHLCAELGPDQGRESASALEAPTTTQVPEGSTCQPCRLPLRECRRICQTCYGHDCVVLGGWQNGRYVHRGMCVCWDCNMPPSARSSR
jgi:hypothetical protein